MGAWSVSITGNDTAEDLKSEYQAAFFYYDVETALSKIDEYVRAGGFDESDEEEWCNYYYSLADFMWRKGILTNSVRDTAVQMIDSEFGLALWGESGEKVLTYTADTGWFSSLNASCKDSRYLLAEASLKEYELAERGDTHMTARQAAQLAQHSGVQNLILTHFSPEHNLNQLRREAEAHYEGNLYMSASGKKYILQP